MAGFQKCPATIIAVDYNFNDSPDFLWDQYSYFDEEPTLRIADTTLKSCLYVRINRDFFQENF
jgi:hypothetical protein